MFAKNTVVDHLISVRKTIPYYTDILVYLKRKVRLSAGWDSEGSSVSVVVGTSVTFSALDGSVRLLGGDDIEGSLFSTTGDGADKIEKKKEDKNKHG